MKNSLECMDNNSMRSQSAQSSATAQQSLNCENCLALAYVFYIRLEHDVAFESKDGQKQFPVLLWLIIKHH